MSAELKSPSARDTAWWLAVLRRRALKMAEEPAGAPEPPRFANETARRAAIAFFNAAFRAEESGLRQAHELASEVADWDPELGEVLRLYGDEEGWHRELLEDFLRRIGGGVAPMGRVTSLLYRAYARAERMETIVLTNLMFETIGATTYRMALRNVREPAVRRMLTILTRDESFHVPLNVHFLRAVLTRRPAALARARVIYRLTFLGLVLLPLASRPKARAFDRIGTLELARAYARELAGLFDDHPELGFAPPPLVLRLLGVKHERGDGQGPTSLAAAERAAERERVVVEEL
ncbi:MAG TPA: ferritin-like domain-containing protein [Polyangiaceae bacterium]|nr:ferritin-like domain-containing protein [Polyangiaceae bacterium]